METKIDEITLRKSTNEYDPYWIIERNGETLATLYIDTCNSPSQAQMIATSLYLKLTNYFNT